MRFLADEGVDGTIVGSIRGDGHDVRWMAEELQGRRLGSTPGRPIQSGIIASIEFHQSGDRRITIPTRTIACRRSYEAALIAFTFTRTRRTSRRMFTWTATTSRASSGCHRSPWE
jgi:hypothetical protein